MTGRSLAAALVPLLLASGATAQSLTCTSALSGFHGRSAEGEWTTQAAEVPLAFTVTATDACATTRDGCEASLTLDMEPGLEIPCTGMGPGSGLVCNIQDIAHIYLHTGTMAFMAVEVEHLIEGRRDPEILVATGSCEPA